MTFNSVPYLVLLAVAVLVHWMLPPRFRKAFVFVVSVAFYGSWGIVFVWLPLLVAGIVFAIGRQITLDPVATKTWVRFGITCLLGLLILFKYRQFVLSNLILIGIPIGAGRTSFVASIAFPAGISFYIFEAIGYLIDLRQGRVKMPSFVDLCLFFFFWPNILSGPIVRARELMPQLSFERVFEAGFVFRGMDRIIWGLVQKNVVANVLGTWVDRGFVQNGTGIPTTVDGWCLAIAFALQIYFDFAGYSNIAIGTACLMGVTLPENFRQPYHAGTPAEFWTRWHMTLSRWIRDYLFFPINARWKGAPVPLYVSLLAVMALVGLWHGAGWGFMVWGLLHGAYLVVYRMYEVWKTVRPNWNESILVSGSWRVLTLMGITAAWVPFRAPTLQKAGTILSSMFCRFASGGRYGHPFYALLTLMVAFCVIEPALIRKLGELDERSGGNGLSVFRVVARQVAYLFGLLLFLLFDEHNAQFIYSRF